MKMNAQDETVKLRAMHQAAVTSMGVKKTPPVAGEVQRLAANIRLKKVLPFLQKHRQDVFAPVCPEHMSQVKCYKHFCTAFSSLPFACGVYSSM